MIKLLLSSNAFMLQSNVHVPMRTLCDMGVSYACKYWLNLPKCWQDLHPQQNSKHESLKIVGCMHALGYANNFAATVSYSCKMFLKHWLPDRVSTKK